MASRRNWQVPLIWGLIGTVLGAGVALGATALTAVVNDPDALEPGEIVVLSPRDDSIDGQRQVLINQWNELHPDTPARIVELSELADEQRSEMLARAQSGRGEIDVYNLDVTWIAEFADAGHIRSLDEPRVRAEGFLDKPLATCRYAGRLWALPFNTDVGLLYYRSDLVTDPPRSWEALERQVAEVRGQPGNVADGYAGQFADYEGLTVNALELVAGSADDPIADDDGVIDLDGQMEAMDAGLERLRAIVPVGVPALDETQSVELFRSGRALFMRAWPVAYRSLAPDRAQDVDGGPDVPFDVTLLPEGSGVLGGSNLAVSAHSARPRAAQALIEFLTSERSQQLLFERGGLPATQAVVYHDQAVRDRYPYVTTLEEAIDRSVLRPVEPHYARFSEVFRVAVDEYLRRGEQLPADFQDQLDDARQGRLGPIENE